MSNDPYFDTSCKKCGASQRELPPPNPANPESYIPFTVTGYRCDKCDHWNDLSRRKRGTKRVGGYFAQIEEAKKDTTDRD